MLLTCTRVKPLSEARVMSEIRMESEVLIRSELMDEIPGLVFGMSTRLGGVSAPPFGMNVSYRVCDNEDHVLQNRERFLGRLGIRAERVAVPVQIHSNSIRVVSSPGTYHDSDGLVSAWPDLYVGVTVADCVPVILVDPVNRVVAAVHAGWRGTAAQIVRVAVDVMSRECGTEPGDIVAYLGPAAGVCCYEVGEEVASRFPGETVVRRGAAIYLDVRKANRLQLLESGVLAARIEESTLCTISEETLLHSYRRDGSRSGRMMAVVGFRG